MATSREAANPLRPYYIPPSIGFPPESAPAPSSSSPRGASAHSNGSTYASSARDIFGDMDYSDYVSDDNKSTLDMIRQMLDDAMYKYLAVLLAQPFDVAKTVLQVRSQGVLLDGTSAVKTGSKEAEGFVDSRFDYASDDSDPDEPAYFTSSHPPASSSPSRSRKHVTDRAGYVLPSPSDPSAPHQLSLKRSDSILDVIGALWTKEGVWGVWKGTNATFVYAALLRTFENWARSFLSAALNAPDPGLAGGLAAGLDVIDSPYPWSSLGIAIGAAAMAGLVLTPLDIIRTKLMITSTTSPRKGLLGELKQLPSWLCPSSIFLPTLLHSTISPLIIHSTPLLLRSQFGIDALQSPNIFSFFTFASQTVELFVKLPLETVLRRGQLAVLASETYVTGREFDAVVDVGGYNGVFGTMWRIVKEEGQRSEGELGQVGASGNRRVKREVVKQGQGVEGLWRGWRVGMWGLVGMWGAAAMGGIGGNGGEF